MSYFLRNTYYRKCALAEVPLPPLDPETPMAEPIKYLTQDEVKRLFRKIESVRDRAMFALIYYYGLRVTEATLIRPEDIFFERNRIYIRRVKSGISGEKPLLSRARRYLSDYLEERKDNGMALFTGKKGNLSSSRIRKLFYLYAKKARLKGYSVHSLRHSIAVHLLEQGETERYVQDHLGHKDIRSTTIYASVTDRLRERAFRRMEQAREIAKV